MKVEMDCENCDGKNCCTLKVMPFDLEMRCINCVDGLCTVEETKPISCALYPFLLVANEGVVLLTIDQNCPQWEQAEIQEAMRVIIEREKELIILSLTDLEYFGFKLKILGRLN